MSLCIINEEDNIFLHHQQVSEIAEWQSAITGLRKDGLRKDGLRTDGLRTHWLGIDGPRTDEPPCNCNTIKPVIMCYYYIM